MLDTKFTTYVNVLLDLKQLEGKTQLKVIVKNTVVFGSLLSRLCDPMDCSRPTSPVRHSLPEFSQTHVH